MQNRTLLAGTARVDITPDQPISMGGYGQRAGKTNQGIHDPLFAKAVFLTDGNTRLLLIGTDLIAIPDLIYQRVVDGLVSSGVMKESEICLTASHTHSGPDVDEALIIASAARSYTDSLVANLVALGRAASVAPVPVDIKLATGKVDFLRNRRRADPNDWLDKRVLAIELVETEKKKSFAVIFGVGCHAVCLGHDNLLISADYPGAAQRNIEENLGVRNAVFVNLTEGNVIPETRPRYDSLDTRGYLGGSFDDAENMGMKLGTEVVRILKKAKPTSLNLFGVLKRRVVVQPARTDLSILGAIRTLLQQRCILLEYLPEFKQASIFNLKPVHTLWRDASDMVITRKMDENEMRRLMSAVSTFLVMAMKLVIPAYRKPAEVIVQTIVMNEFSLMTMPGEVLVEVGREWQSRLQPLQDTAFIIGLANGFKGYLPHPDNFNEEGAEFKYETIMNALEKDATLIALDQAAGMVAEQRSSS